jgi:hypothetical protein
MPKPDMKSSYRLAQELLKDRLREKAPEMLDELEAIHAADVIVVRGEYDHIEQVLEAADSPFTGIDPKALDRAKLRPDQVVFINCPGQLGKKGLRKLQKFVHDGGFLFTTDWALRHVIEKAFPGYLEFNERPTRDEVVRIEILDQEDKFLPEVLDKDEDPQWWLESSSYPITILDAKRVKVLIRSKEIERQYGEAPVLVSFEHGEGLVYHMISHFYLQRSETRTARHAAPSMDYVTMKGIPLADLDKYKQMGAASVSTGDLESAYTSYAMIKSILYKKRETERLRRKKD